MTVWIVWGCILLALLLISRVRMGGSAEFGREGLLIQIRLGLFRLTVYPWKRKKKCPREKKREETSKPPQEPAGEPPSKTGGPLSDLKRFLPLAADAAGRLKQKIRIDKLYLDFTAAAADPAAAAMAFGGTNAALGMIWPLLENNFNIKDRRIRTAINFNAQTPTVWFFASFSLTIGQALLFTLWLVVRFLRTLSDAKAQKRKKESV